jgi:hypothetical protein
MGVRRGVLYTITICNLCKKFWVYMGMGIVSFLQMRRPTGISVGQMSGRTCWNVRFKQSVSMRENASAGMTAMMDRD